MQGPYSKKSYFSITDIAVIIFIITAIIWFFIETGNTFNYKLDLFRIPQYFIRKDQITGELRVNILLTGFFVTVKLSIWSTILAFAIGTIFGFLRFKGSPLQRFSGWFYVETIRNIPSIVLVFIFYFFVSSQFLDFLGLDIALRNSSSIVQNIISFLFTGKDHINAFISAVLTLAVYEGAYVAEIVRGGLAGIPKGQWDAGKSLGMNGLKTFRFIILPQALRNVLSPLAGQFISTIKDSAIMSVISIQELTFQGMEIMSATLLTFEVWITITLLYFSLTFTLSRFTAWLENYFSEKY